MIVGAISAGENLAAEADAEHGLAGIAEAAREPGELRQIGMGFVIQRALLAAENDQRVMFSIPLFKSLGPCARRWQ